MLMWLNSDFHNGCPAMSKGSNHTSRARSTASCHNSLGQQGDWSKIFHRRISYWRCPPWVKISWFTPRVRAWHGPASYPGTGPGFVLYCGQFSDSQAWWIWFGTSSAYLIRRNSFYLADDMCYVGILNYLSFQLVTTRPQHHSWPPPSANVSSWEW